MSKEFGVEPVCVDNVVQIASPCASVRPSRNGCAEGPQSGSFVLPQLMLLRINGFEIARHMELIYRKQKYVSPVTQRFREFVHGGGARRA